MWSTSTHSEDPVDDKMTQASGRSLALDQEPVNVQLVFTAQQILQEANVLSVVTGDFGMSYHGVDIVVHDIELCVTKAHRTAAVAALRKQPALYEDLGTITEPNFYHPYKKGAARFKILYADEPFELHIVTNNMLDLALNPSTVEVGLTHSTVHPEFLDMCRGISDAVLERLVWPTLAGFLDGWLHMAGVYKGLEVSSIYLMQSERLIDVNDVNDAWFERTFNDAANIHLAKQLLKGKEHRRIRSTFD